MVIPDIHWLNWLKKIFIGSDDKWSLKEIINARKGKMDVKLRDKPELCTGEKEFITNRKKVVFENMKKKFLQIKEEDAPNIAIIGSGGGMRAVIGMCGAMTALHDIGILNYTMYTAGVSGSAWYLMALYANDKQHFPNELNEIIRQRVKDFRYSTILRILVRRNRDALLNAYFTPHKQLFKEITNSFGEMIQQLLLREDFCNKWYRQKQKLKNGSVPLPLLAALHIRNKKKIKDYNEWIEFSPYEMYIPRYCAAIDMEKFGHQFYGGFAIKELRTSSLKYLLGICGSGFTKVREWRPEDSKWYMIFGINDLIGFIFDILDITFVAKVPNCLFGMKRLKTIVPSLADRKPDATDTSGTRMLIVDAGISFNSPYPTVLHPSRKIDLILSFDFSQRSRDRDWPFTELEKAERWARERQVPFPKIYPQLYWVKKEWQQGVRKEVYVFSGDNTPTIVHFVTINQSFRKAYTKDGVEHDFEVFPKYRTIKFNYSKQDFNQLSLLVKHNVTTNSKTVDHAIEHVIIQKQNRNKELEGQQ